MTKPRIFGDTKRLQNEKTINTIGIGYQLPKQYNCRCFIETPTKRTPQKDSLIKSAGYQEANLECQKKNRQLNDSTDKVCNIF